MLRDILLDQLAGNNTRPNKFTIGMGKLIRVARENMGYSQRDLAELIHRRQAALSDMENGKMEPDASTLCLLAYVLNKPLISFFPEPWKSNVFGEIGEYEQELMILYKKLDSKDQKTVLIQLRALVNN